VDLATLIILTKKESYFLKKIRGEWGAQRSVKSDSYRARTVKLASSKDQI